MQRESRAIKPAALGIIGEDHLRQRLCILLGGDIDTFRYCRKLGTTDGLPYVIEAAFAYAPGDDDRSVIAGVNWSPSVHGVPFDSLGRDWTLAALLQEQRCGRGEPIILAVHLAIPRVSFPTLGKSGISLDGELAEAFTAAVVGVTSKWCKQRRAEERDHRRTARRHDAMVRSAKVTVKDAAYAAIPAAYFKASGNGKYPAKARQVMYAGRHEIQDATGEQLDDRYFTQGLLPDFCNEHPELTASWDIVYDARGHFREPHTGREIALGTLGVREYLSDISRFQANWHGAVRLPEIQLGERLRTVGPQYRYGNILFCEKEGFDSLWESIQLQERYDLSTMSCKGVSSTSGRHLLDGLTQYSRQLGGRFGHSAYTILTWLRSRSGIA